MTPLLEAALDLQTALLRQNWRFCIIGGIAVLRWGEPRFTRDVDLTLLAGFGREHEFIEPTRSWGYRGRIPDAAVFARRNRVLLVESPGGISIDIVLGGLPFESLLVQRATLFDQTTRASRLELHRGATQPVSGV